MTEQPASVDRELLQAIARAETSGGTSEIDVDSLCADTGFERSAVQASLKRLHQDGLIGGASEAMLGTGLEMSAIRLTGKGARSVER
jgi:hypothetical protein